MQPRLAIATRDRGPVDLLGAAGASGSFDVATDTWAVSTADLIEAGPELWRRAELVAAEAPEEFEVDCESDDVSLLCPLDRAASLRDFLAFEDHVKRGADRRGGTVPDYWYEAPVYYKGNHRSLIGPEDDCPWPAYSDYLDFELELAMVVGRRGRDIEVEAAADFIFGFTILNDFSARDIQMKEVTAWLGPAKGKDFCNALGPCIVTADELGSQPDLEMKCSVNGEEWGRGRSGDVRWTWGEMMAHVSRDEDVFPGDIYGSGTPGGCCGLDLDRKLAPGDVVELQIDKIGTLRNRIAERR